MSKLEKLGGVNRFTVIKHTDINEYLSECDSDGLHEACSSIVMKRLKAGKPINEYIVINLDDRHSEKEWTLGNKGGES